MWCFGWVVRDLCDQLKIGSFITKYKGEESGCWEALNSISVSAIKSWRRNAQRPRSTPRECDIPKAKCLPCFKKEATKHANATESSG